MSIFYILMIVGGLLTIAGFITQVTNFRMDSSAINRLFLSMFLFFSGISMFITALIAGAVVILVK